MSRTAGEARVELTAPLADLPFPLEVELARLSLEIEGSPLGEIELPVCDGCLPAGVIADTAAAEHAWAILGRFFEATAGGWQEADGWLLFLRDLWGKPDWTGEWFYIPPPDDEESASPLRASEGWTKIEVSRPLPHLLPRLEDEGLADVALAVGGVVIGGVKVPAPIGPAGLRAALTAAAGYELCRAAVREALIGAPLAGPPLRQRLAARAGMPEALWTPAPCLVFGGTARHPIGSTASRRATLPWDAMSDLLEATKAADVPVGIRGDILERIVVAPEILGKPLPEAPPPPAAPVAPAADTEASEDVGAGAEETTSHLPILLYHRVAPEGAPETARYRVTPEAFDEQLRHLREAGYRSVRLSEWAEAMARRRPLPGRAVAITFDDGYEDFLTHAWPALRRHGFSATLFLVAGEVGGMNRWDEAELGERLPLLGWDCARRLVEEGVEIGSHSHGHANLTELSNVEVARDAARSRAELERNLGTVVTALAYPWGMNDAAVRHLAGGCGYLLGLDSKGGRSNLLGNPLCLPRIEITGTDDVASFMEKIAEEAAP